MRHTPVTPILLSMLLTAQLVSIAGAQEPESPTPATAETTTGDESAPVPEEAAPEVSDLDALRAEYLKLRDSLFQSQARAATVSSALYSTRLSLRLDYSSARYYTITRATVRLDGANVFDDSEGGIASNKAPRFEGFIAPGRHQINIRIEATAKDDPSFSTVLDNTFTIQAPKGKDLLIKAAAEDDGNMPYQWSKSGSGSYKLHLDVSVKAAKRKQKSKHLKRTGRLGSQGRAKSA